MEPLVVIFVALFARERNAQATNMVPMSTIVFIRLLILVSPDLEKVKPSRAALIGGIMCPTTCLALASLSCFSAELRYERKKLRYRITILNTDQHQMFRNTTPLCIGINYHTGHDKNPLVHRNAAFVN